MLWLIIIFILFFLWLLMRYNSNPYLYERLGGVYNISAIVAKFSMDLLNDPLVGVNSNNKILKEWYEKNPEKLPGLMFMRTLWICSMTGGPFKFHGVGGCQSNETHYGLNLTTEEFQAVLEQLANAMDYFKVDNLTNNQLLMLFINNKDEVLNNIIIC